MATKIETATKALGRYFGVLTKDSFMSKLVSTADLPENPTEDELESFNPTPAEQSLHALFVDVTEGALMAPDMIQLVKQRSAGADDKFKKRVEETFLITYEGNDENIPGVSKNKISDMLKTPEKVISKKKGVKFKPVANAQEKSPDKVHTCLSSTQIFPAKLTLANRDTNAVGIFCNAIPTLEISRCIPFINITLISPIPMLSEDGRIQTTSIMQFIRGQVRLLTNTDSGPDFDIASAVNSGVLATDIDPSLLSRLSEDQRQEREASVADGGPGVSSAGMELFTSPQTMLPLNELDQLEDFSDMEPIEFTDADKERAAQRGIVLEERSVGARRATGLLDKFRPFMTLESLNINVTPTKGFMSHKTAELSLVLHDRSRLSEIAPFVKPDLYGGTELMIEYGWSHPDGGINSDNAFGMFLDSLRTTEKYVVVNSSYTFDDVGQVNIKAKLAMKGAVSMQTTSIGKGPGVADAIEEVDNLTKAVAKLKAKLGKGAGGSTDVAGKTIFSAAGSTSKALTIDDETRAAIVKFIKGNKNADAESSTGQLKEKLVELFGKDGKGGKTASAKATISDGVSRKLAMVAKGTPDHYMRPYKGKFTKWDEKTHVSLGKLLMVFCGEPLAATGKWDAIEFFFYAFNPKSSYLRDFNTSQLPVNRADFEEAFKEKTKTTANLPIKSFLSFIQTEFVTDQASDCFGLASLFKEDDKGKKQVKDKYKEATVLNDEKQLRLKEAYGTESNDLSFKMPRLTMYFESLKTNPKESLPTPDSVGSTAKTVLRIHVYDTQCTQYESLGDMIAAARKDSMGILTKSVSKVKKKKEGSDQEVDPGHVKSMMENLQAAIDRDLIEVLPVEVNDDGTAGTPKKLSQFSAEELETKQFRMKGGFPALKSFVKRTMPTMTYGSQNSAILEASLSTQNSPELASVNMIRGGLGAGTTAQGARDGGVPLQVTPTQLSLKMIGNPLINYGQHFFIDFGTGTTIDNRYVVTGIDHTIESGVFETNLKLIQLDAFGTYTSLLGNIQRALTVLKGTEKK